MHLVVLLTNAPPAFTAHHAPTLPPSKMSVSAFAAPVASGATLRSAAARRAVTPHPPHRRTTPKALAGAAVLLNELNSSHVRELGGLIISFGAAHYSWDCLTSIRAVRVDEAGLAVEAVMCDGEGCVARLEELTWPTATGTVAGVDEALTALRDMIGNAGLDEGALDELETVIQAAEVV